jgi:O-antigen ligase
MHYLASFTVITLPPVVYALFATKGWSRYLFVPVILLDIDLILKIGSRPAILGLTTGTLFVAVFLIKGYWRWIGLLLILAILSELYLSGYAGLDSRFEELLINLTREERVYLWKASWEMLKDNTLITWILGSGIGAVHSVYPRYTPVDLQMFFFPHLHVVEVLYDSGIVGAILFLAGLLSLLALSVKFLKNAADKNSCILMRCLLVSHIAWLIHSGLTFPFYSKYAQYSLAYILGPMLVLLSGKADKSKHQSLTSKPLPAI